MILSPEVSLDEPLVGSGTDIYHAMAYGDGIHLMVWWQPLTDTCTLMGAQVDAESMTSLDPEGFEIFNYDPCDKLPLPIAGLASNLSDFLAVWMERDADLEVDVIMATRIGTDGDVEPAFRKDTVLHLGFYPDVITGVFFHAQIFLFQDRYGSL